VIIPVDGGASEELVVKILSMGDGAEAAVDDLLCAELHAVLEEVEPLLHDRGELTDPTTLPADHVLGTRGADDDLLAHQCHVDLDARVSILGQLLGQHLIQLGVLFETTLRQGHTILAPGIQSNRLEGKGRSRRPFVGGK
jgi:hypothetical protein